MLYDIDDEKENEILKEEKVKFKLSKKIVICLVIILCCITIMIISVFWAKKSNENSEIAETENTEIEEKNKSNTVKANTKINEKEHIQIAKHDIEKIKLKFVPKENPNAQEEITNIYYSDEKVAYLTFDDGPSKNITPQILDILKQEEIPATFFVLGSRVELNPDLVKREFEEGHYIANHGYSHTYSLIYSSVDMVYQEYMQCQNAVRNALDNQEYNTFLFRFPGGSAGGKYAEIKAQAKEMLHNYGIVHTNWNCLTGDAEGKTTPEALMGSLQETMKGDGSIIVLMHDASDKSYTAETLPTVISYLREQGYTFKNFYEIFS